MQIIKKWVMERWNQGSYRAYSPGIVAAAKGTVLCYDEARRDDQNDRAKTSKMVQRRADGGKSLALYQISKDDRGIFRVHSGLSLVCYGLVLEHGCLALSAWQEKGQVRDGERLPDPMYFGSLTLQRSGHNCRAGEDEFLVGITGGNADITWRSDKCICLYKQTIAYIEIV